jgi:hypothetical protein
MMTETYDGKGKHRFLAKLPEVAAVDRKATILNDLERTIERLAQEKAALEGAQEYAHHRAADQEELIADLLAALRAVEWGGPYVDYEMCGMCGYGPESGHKPDCQLAAAIERAEAER